MKSILFQMDEILKNFNKHKAGVQDTLQKMKEVSMRGSSPEFNSCIYNAYSRRVR